MKILVTGGAGFIGSHLVDRLVRNHQVMVIDDFSGGNTSNLNHRSSVMSLDLRNTQTTNIAISEFKPDIVYHLAANAAENKAQFSPIDVTSRNWNTFINTLVPFINGGGKKFIFTSSIAVYGKGQTPFKETDRPEPEDLYGISKYAIEQALQVMSKVHDFEYVIARPHNVYGPRQNMTDPYRNVVTIFMNAILNKKGYYIYGDGEQIRNFTYIDDVTDALESCGEISGNHIFNIGSSKSYTIKELSDAIQKTTGIEVPITYLPERPQEVKIAISDHTLANEKLKYRDKTTLEDGLRATWEWCKDQGPKQPLYTNIEIKSNKLPENWK